MLLKSKLMIFLCAYYVTGVLSSDKESHIMTLPSAV